MSTRLASLPFSDGNWPCYCRPVPDDERRRRRVGDETKERIADLASGWSVDVRDAGAAPAAEPPKRKKPKTQPPPPPGSAERKALEAKIIETPAGTPPGERAKPPTAPPPIPRAKPPTAPPPIPPLPPRAKPDDRPFASEVHTPAVIIDASLQTEPAIPALPAAAPPPPPPLPPLPLPKLTVPVGEFDSGVKTIDEEAVRRVQAQSTVVRDPAEALLKIEASPPRDDPTAIDSAIKRYDRAADATEIQAPSMEGKTVSGGTLRAYAALRRKRGIAGDVRYVFTALFGVRSSRRELATLEQRQQVRQTSRRRHLVTLGRTAVTADAFDHAALAEAREALAMVEDERSKHAGAVAAADAELERVRRDRADKAKQYASDVAAREAELVDLAKKQEPLEKAAAAARKRATELRESLQRIDKQLAATEAKLHSVHIDKMDRAGIHAEIATFKADRQAVQRDEPVLAAELDALNPRIAAIEAARVEARKQRKALDDGEAEDQRRTSELLEAIGAKRKVVERASGEAEAARDRVLFELGERLYVDRPKILGAQLSPIDQIDLELGDSDRRVMELREILSNIDKAKLARGAAVILLAVVAVGGFIAWLLYQLL
jgi:hypothetical protein